MSDLENMAFLKLRPVNDTRITEQVRPLLCDGERILQQYQGIRDAILFTDRRVKTRYATIETGLICKAETKSKTA